MQFADFISPGNSCYNVFMYQFDPGKKDGLLNTSQKCSAHICVAALNYSRFKSGFSIIYYIFEMLRMRINFVLVSET